MFRQEIVAGIPASVSLLSDGARVVPIATNQQVLRGDAAAPWGYAGSVTPFPLPGRRREMTACAREALRDAGCRGSAGMDFVLGEERAWGIEINPRFQATLDTVELATGVNLFSLHVQACDGVLPRGMLRIRRFAARRILFASQDCTIRHDCSGLAPMVADIPAVGSRVEEGGAIISVYGTGPTAVAAQATLSHNTQQVQAFLGLQESTL
jgi:predicted ATP-grasp superfamily ATP-dependent carboligase